MEERNGGEKKSSWLAKGRFWGLLVFWSFGNKNTIKFSLKSFHLILIGDTCKCWKLSSYLNYIYTIWP